MVLVCLAACLAVAVPSTPQEIRDGRALLTAMHDRYKDTWYESVVFKEKAITINPDAIIPPQTNRPLIIEGVGGVFVPFTTYKTSFDLFKKWDGKWIVVSKHYLGSINHTLLTVDMLKRENIQIAGIIFNGEHNPDTENAILEITKISFLGCLEPEHIIDKQTIQKYTKLWKPKLQCLIH